MPPGTFHRGLRLLAIDGTSFNLRNTPAIGERAVKVPCGRDGGEPAFARQPVKDWPKMKQPTSLPLLKSITIDSASP